jgi:hypothetical protein
VALGWGAHGHRTITRLALEALPPDTPAFLREPAVRDRIVEESNEPDRWRSTKLPALGHENNPDHYLDVEKLDQFGLTLETVPRLRYDYVEAMAVAKHAHPEMIEPYDRRADPDGSGEWPGFVLHAISEHYAKLRSSFNTLRTLESLNDPARSSQLVLARENIIHEMGLPSHFVGEPQPLHHPPPRLGGRQPGATRYARIHASIDTDIVLKHGLAFDRSGIRSSLTTVDGGTVGRTSATSPDRTPRLSRSTCREKRLAGPDGKRLISERLCDGAAMLGALYRAAWESSETTEREIMEFVKYNNLEGPAAAGAEPRTSPARAPSPKPSVAPDSAPPG